MPSSNPGVDLPNPGIESRSPALRADCLLTEPPGKPKNTGVGSLSLLQRIFLTQELNQGLLPCRWIFYQLSYQGSHTAVPNTLQVPQWYASICYQHQYLYYQLDSTTYYLPIRVKLDIKDIKVAFILLYLLLSVFPLLSKDVFHGSNLKVQCFAYQKNSTVTCVTNEQVNNQ